MINKKIKIITGILILLAITIALNSRKTDNKNGIVIKDIKPYYGAIQITISTTGTVEPQNRLEIKPPIAGRIEKILVKEGAYVKTGQILALMSSTDRAALLDAAQLKNPEELKYWEEVYKPAPLIAPIDGEVIVRAVEPGQTVTSNDAVLVLSDRLIVKAQVDETDIGGVKVGQAAIVSLDAYPQIKTKAHVDHISYESTIVNNVTIYEVDILPDTIPEVFRSGMSANVDIIKENESNSLLIPVDAVNSDKTGSYVLLKEPGKNATEKRKIETGISDGTNIAVTSGLSKDDTIIIKEQSLLPTEESKQTTNPFGPPFSRRRR